MKEVKELRSMKELLGFKTGERSSLLLHAP
jgi:hypothetical protein